MPNILIGQKEIAISRPDKRMNMFIQGGITTSFTLPKEITSIEEYAFHNISGLTEVIFTNKDRVVEVDENSDIPADAKFIVPAKFLSDYQAKYPNRTVEARGAIWTIPFSGDSTLTKAYINQSILQEPEITNAEVVIVPEEFTTFEQDAIQRLCEVLPKLTCLEIDVEDIYYPRLTSHYLYSDPLHLISNIVPENAPSMVRLPNLTFATSYEKQYVIPSSIEYLQIGSVKDGAHFSHAFSSTSLKTLSLGSVGGMYVYANYWSGGIITCNTLENIHVGVINMGAPNPPSFAINNGGKTLNLTVDSILSNVALRWSNAKFTDASLHNVIEALHDYSSGSAHTLTLSAADLTRITNEDKQSVESKN